MNANMEQVKEIFLAAVENHAPSEWAAHLDHACQGDILLREQVELLLEAHADGSLLDKGAIAPAETVVPELTSSPGDTIGPYKLLQQIGEGGMGVVYMAEQTEPVERRVALKIIKPGMDSRQVIARFEAERQALAMMDHPNIAKVLDAGTTESGRPYFVMELVKGQPVTQYCDEQQLTPRERLELFLPICRAVQHAHQKGVIHRDLKPSNILIARYDDKAVPKIIDFGVAKAISQRLTEKTMFTQYGQIVGTIEYMAPEQAQFNQLDVDTRSDIYSLGVLLYELLTGETPFDKQRLRSAAFDELLRIIREEEPPRPSVRLSTSATLPSIAASRHIEPHKLSTLVCGELDWIVMKALEKDRTRRYETASAFASDVQHYLNDEAVLACPPSAGYRMKKFVRRNRLPLTVLTLVATTLLLGMVGMLWQASRAARVEQDYLNESARRIEHETTLNEERIARANWIPEIQRLLESDRRFEALDLAQQAREVVPDDPILAELFNEAAMTVTIETNPPGATVEVKEWRMGESDWRSLGQTPIQDVVVPPGPVQLRHSLDGYVTVERLIHFAPGHKIRIQLQDEETSPEGMLLVPGLNATPAAGVRQNVGRFYADIYEVTNREFQEFVDSGGYETADYWQHGFALEGKTIPWTQAIEQFRDRTGRPGPAMWKNSRHPEGEADFPVRGVSWYEAAAYAAFVGKRLPTIHHWARAASLHQAEHISRLSNFSGEGPVEVGRYSGVSQFGLYDMAGNVKEWCWNEGDPGQHWIRGGSWREPAYMIGQADTAPSFSREDDFGFRCVRYLQEPSPEALAAAPPGEQDYRQANPPTSDVLAQYCRHFLTDRELPLNATTVSTDDTHETYRYAIVEIDAAYANERLILHLFFPRHAIPPLQSIIYFPGAAAAWDGLINEVSAGLDLRLVLGLVRHGRVVCWPAYQGTLERKLTSRLTGQIQGRDLRVQQVKDAIRAVDYLEAQPNLDSDKVAFVGFSWGGNMGPIVAAVEPRLRACAFLCGGLQPHGADGPPEINTFNYAAAVDVPVLMINGRYDQYFPMAESQIPLFDALATDQKHLVHFDSGHFTPETSTIQQTNEWMDQYLGPPLHNSTPTPDHDGAEGTALARET